MRSTRMCLPRKCLRAKRAGQGTDQKDLITEAEVVETQIESLNPFE
jgi:hypothetical protein